MQVQGPNLSSFAKSVVILSIAFIGAVASANPNIFSHSILGEVHVASPRDQEYFDRFLPYLEKAHRIAIENNISNLNIELTFYSSAIDNEPYLEGLPLRSPFYLPPLKTLVIGGLNPRPRTHQDELAQHAGSLHEVGHAYLFSYFKKFGSQESPLERSAIQSAHNDSFLPYNELFADLFAGMIINNPNLIVNEVRNYFEYERRRQGPLDRLLSAVGALPSFSVMKSELENRELRNVVEHKPCGLHLPDIHNMFPRSRSFLWQKVFVEMYGRDPNLIHEIVDKLSWFLYNLNHEIFQHELRREQSLRRLGVSVEQENQLTLSQRLLVVPPYLSFGHEWLDEQLLTRLREAFP